MRCGIRERYIALNREAASGGQILAALGSCMLGIVGDLGNSASGCPLSVSYEFYVSR